MTKAIRISKHGGPEVMSFEEIELPPPGPGEVRMKNHVIGINFIDTYHRSGLYPIQLPSGLGVEAAGVVEAVGEGVEGFAPGDRVCAVGPTVGAYSTERNIAAKALFFVPDYISDEQAAASALKAFTVEALVERCAKVQPKWPVLVHAAAGGVGLILVQWLKHVGATVIGTASTAEKMEEARRAGADHMINAHDQGIAAQVRELTGGEGVRVAFDGVGAATWDITLDACASRGMIVSFGNASGPVTGVSLATLANKGSLFVTRPGLYAYYADPAERKAGSEYVFDLIRQGIISVPVNQRFALENAAQAHRDLEARKTTGSSVLIP